MVSARIAEAFSNGSINTTAYPYITPEYLSETRDPQAIGAIIFLLCFTAIVLLLRVFSRVFLVKSFGLDDGLAIFGFVLFVAFTAMGLVLIKEGSGRHLEYIQYILTPEEVDLTEINDYAAHLIYTAALFVCRLSGLAFYYRLCIRHQILLRIIVAATVFLVSAFLPQFFLILLHCSPTTGLWPYAWQTWSPAYTCLPWGVVYVTNSALSLVCDFIIFTIPIAIITMIKLSKERKVMLAFVLLPGTFVIAISCVRLWLCVVGQWRDDGSWYYNPQIAIEVAEIGGTLIALSIPGLKALIGTVNERMRSSMDRTYPRSAAGRMTLAGGPEGDSKIHEGATEHSHYKTSINARVSSRGSAHSDSDDDLLASVGAQNIFVQRHVDQVSIAMTPIEHKQSPAAYA